METDVIIEIVVAGVALILLGVTGWVEASLGTARELTIRELLSDRLSRTPDSDVDETTQIRTAMLLIQLMMSGLAMGLIAHVSLNLDVTGSFAIGLIVGALLLILVGRVVPAMLATSPEDVWSSWAGRTGRVLRALFIPIVWPVEQIQRYSDLASARREQEGEGEHQGDGDGGVEGQSDSGPPEELQSEEHEMITGILQLGDATADDLMVPRLDLVAVPVTATVAENR